MKLRLLFLITILFVGTGISQIVTTQPFEPTESDSIVIIFDATQPGAEELLNYTGILYAHTGVTVDSLGTIKNWQYVIGDWANNTNQPVLDRLGTNLYKLTVGYPRTFYSVTNSNEKIIKLSLVFRTSDATKQTRPDIFIDLYVKGINLIFQNPEVDVSYGDPLRSPAFINEGDTVEINVLAVEVETKVSSLSLFVDGSQVEQTDTNQLTYDFVHSNYTLGAHNITAVGVDTSGRTDSTSFIMFVNPIVQNLPIPAGIEPGITYTGATTATLALFAPLKDYIYVIGDFNDWKVSASYYMNKHEVTQDSVIWWLNISGLSPGTEYAFQYYVDGKIRTGEPYSEKILDPWNDKYISPTVYPSLKAYPVGKTSSVVSVLRTAQSPYPWIITDFVKPPKEKLVIYELLVRDFSTQRTFQFLKDTLSYLKSLGVNAIELMPIMEFSGNNSWGYNPIYHVAVDKAYGPADSLKVFIDLCHQNGIAVILDMVLNQADNLSPLAMLWWDDANSRPAADNPYLNIQATHPYSVFNDFNHESSATKYFVDRVNKYWLNEFKFDGFRFDLSKGFTQVNSGTNVGLWGQYDQSRIDIIKRMADRIREIDSTAYVILEHFADNSEETVLANYGMLLWGNMNHQYNEATMGYSSDLNGVSYKSRGWTVPHLVAYMESHDEERLMYKNIRFGYSAPTYNIKDTSVALNRIKIAAAFYFTIPGPKMIWQFGELGYNYSIFYDPATGTVPEPYGTDYAKTSPKPIRWDFLNDARRTNLYKVFQALINLKTNYEAFSSNDFTFEVSGGYGKRFVIRHPTMDVVIIGNFYISPLNVTGNFTKTGWWYDFFSGDSIDVSNTSTAVPLEPGEFHIFTTVKLPTPEEGILSDVETLESGTVSEYQLAQNYPNPFNPSTVIRYSIINSGDVILKIYDVLGREIKNLVNQQQSNGTYEVSWKGDDNFGNKVSTGIYFYRIETKNFVETKKMIFLK